MNSSPIALRLASGSVTPASFARNRSSAFTWTSGTWKCRANVSSTWSGSPSRLSPWSTKTQVSWSPTARWTSSAATAESTPPLSAQSTRASPTCWADPVDLLVDDVRRGPVREQTAPVVQEPFHHGLPVRGVRHLRVELDGEQAALAILHRGDGDPVGGRGDAEAFGRARDGVAVAHPDGVGRRQVLQQRAGLRDVELGPAVLPVAGRRDLPAEVLRHQLVAVADPEHRDAEVEQPRVDLRRALLVDAQRAAGQDDAGRALRRELGSRQVVRDDLGVDVRLAHPPGDQLGVLRPEIDDEDGARVGHRPPSGPSRRAAGSGRSCPRF